MSASKRPSTSSLRRFITTRPYVTVAELRRRFFLDEPDAVCCVRRNGSHAFIGLPEREAVKLQDLWEREEIGLELSVEVRAPVVIGIYPMHIARFIQDGYSNGASNGHANGTAPNGHANGPSNAFAGGASANGPVDRAAGNGRAARGNGANGGITTFPRLPSSGASRADASRPE